MNIRRIHNNMMKHSKVSFTALMALMIGIVYLSPPVYSSDTSSKNVYYVAVNGNDENAGTLNAPWRTIQKAADTLVAGETVFVREGLYEEFVQIKQSGSAQEGYITFQAFPGERPVLEGKNLTPTGSNNTLLLIRGASYIAVQGFEIRGFTTDNRKDYISGMKVRGGGSHILIANNEIHTISNHATKGNAHGLIVYGDSLTPISDITITGNNIHHLLSGSSESLTLDGNVKDFVIEYNKVHDNNNIGIDIIGHYETCTAPCIDQARNGIVSHNLVYNIDTSTNPAYGSKGDRAAAGIYVDGGTNVIVENNEVFNSNFGIELASEIHGKDTSKVTVRNNYVHHNQGAGIIMGGSGSSNGGARNNTVVNNTLYMNDTMQQGYAEITLQNYNVNNTLVNNILYTFPKQRFIKMSKTNGSGNVIDYNMYYRSDAVDAKSWRYNGISYKTWKEFKVATGFDEHSLYADPQFMDIDKYGPYLSAQSPAIDGGTLNSIGNMNLDFYSQQRMTDRKIDIGAAEFASGIIPSKPVFDQANPTITQTNPFTGGGATIGQQPDSGQQEQSPEGEQAVNPPSSSALADITIDGIGDDWASLPKLKEGDSNAKSMKAFMTSDTLYVLIEGHLLTEKGQLFIDTGAVETPFEAPYWSDNQSGYLVENGTLYTYSGTGGTNWKWTKAASYKNTGHYAVTATAVEYAIPLADLGGVQQSISIGYIWKDSQADRLPMESKMQLIRAIQHFVE